MFKFNDVKFLLVVSIFLSIFLATAPVHAQEGDNWSAGVKINDTSGSEHKYRYTNMIIDPSGNPHVVWQDNSHGSWDIFYDQSDGMEWTWGTDFAIDDDYPAGSNRPGIDMDSAGNLYVIWRGGFPGYDIRFRKSTDGGDTWEEYVQVNDDLGSVYGLVHSPSLVIDRNNDHIYAIWSDSRRAHNSEYDIYFSKSTDGGSTWSSDVRINDTFTSDGRRISNIAVDHNGHLYVVWYDSREGDHDIYFSKSTDEGVTWSDNIKVNDDSTANQIFPDLAVDSQGTVYVVWTDERNDHQDIYAAISNDGGLTWSTDVKINDDTTTTDQNLPSLIVDEVGNLYCAWSDGRAGNADIYFARSLAQSTDHGLAWSANTKASDATDATDQSYPDLAIGPDRKLFLVWSEEGSGTAGIYVSRAIDEAQGFSISGRVTDDEGNPISGVTVEASLSASNSNEINGERAAVDSGNSTLDDGLIAYYKFEDNAEDSSGNGHHGSAQGVAYLPGAEGQAAFFDANTDKVVVSDHDQLDTDYQFSVAAWVHPTQYRSDGHYDHFILSKWDSSTREGDYIFRLTSGDQSGRIGFHVADYDNGFEVERMFSPYSDRVPLSEWVHVAATFDNGLMRIYRNGQLVGELESQTVLHTNLREYSKDYIVIGNLWNSAYSFIGGIDEVRLYDRSLSAEEVCQLADITSYSVSGRVRDDEGNPISGVTVGSSSGNSAVTNASGVYTITGLITGTYTITPTTTEEAYYFVPRTHTVTIPSGSIDLNFTRRRVPIVFVPGIMGSRLFNDEGEEKWAKFPYVLDDMPDMDLEGDGVTPVKTPLHIIPDDVKGIVTEVCWLKRGLPKIVRCRDFYAPTIRHFQELGYQEKENFWVFPYDWRKDLRSAASSLERLVNVIQVETQAEQVYIVAHSMGGLVARQYISDIDNAEEVKGMVFLGTPFLGTPKAFHALQSGTCIIDVGRCIPRRSVVKRVVENYPAFYQLMPSKAYFTLKGSGFYVMGQLKNDISDCNNCLEFDKTYSTTIVPNLNRPLHSKAIEFHTTIDNITDWNGVPVSIVAGKEQETIVGIRQYPYWRWRGQASIDSDFEAEVEIEIVHEPVFSTAGDGTVTTISAGMTNTFPIKNLQDSDSVYWVEVKHGDLATDKDVLSHVDDVLGLGSSKSMLRANTDSITDVASSQVVALGSNAILVEDPDGNYTGPITETDFTTQGIPGSAYFSNDRGMTTVGLLGGQNYTITVVPTGIGPLDVRLVRSTMTETLTTTLYTGISVTDQSRVQLVGDPYLADTWVLDVAGDGTQLQAITPTLAYTKGSTIDVLPPTIAMTVEGALGDQGWYTTPVTVTLTATDNPTGSGVSRIEYAFSNSPQRYIYEEPFVAYPDQVSVLYASAFDQAGNMQPLLARERIGPDKLDSVNISGPNFGFVDVNYTFTATANITATSPITYVWYTSDQAPITYTTDRELFSTAVFSWTKPGVHTVTVTATNVGNVITATHIVTLCDASITKLVSPTVSISHGDHLTYTLLVSATPGTTLNLYDPLDGATFVDFLERPAGITHTGSLAGGTFYLGGLITGALTITPTSPVTVSFVTHVGDPNHTIIWTTDVSNRACLYPVGGTLEDCIWSNTVVNPASYGHRIFLPLVLRTD